MGGHQRPPPPATASTSGAGSIHNAPGPSGSGSATGGVSGSSNSCSVMVGGSRDLVRYLAARERGLVQRAARRGRPSAAATVDLAQELGEEKATLPVKNQSCELSGQSRATFLMTFSPDGTLIASTHGDHTVRVTDVQSGRCRHILTGHPRTPWCIAFHPSSNDILASGCLKGEVRIWDLRGGGSERWASEDGSVIASVTFHPTDQVLVIATSNELLFWDWTRPEPFARCKTASKYERVKWVKFDPLGHRLFTAIANTTVPRDENARSAGSRSTHGVSYINADTSGGAGGVRERRRLQQRYSDLVHQINTHQRDRIMDNYNMAGATGAGGAGRASEQGATGRTQEENMEEDGGDGQNPPSSTSHIAGMTFSGPHHADIVIVEPQSPVHVEAVENAREYASMVTRNSAISLSNARQYAADVTSASLTGANEDVEREVIRVRNDHAFEEHLMDEEPVTSSSDNAGAPEVQENRAYMETVDSVQNEASGLSGGSSGRRDGYRYRHSALWECAEEEPNEPSAMGPSSSQQQQQPSRHSSLSEQQLSSLLTSQSPLRMGSDQPRRSRSHSVRMAQRLAMATPRRRERNEPHESILGSLITSTQMAQVQPVNVHSVSATQTPAASAPVIVSSSSSSSAFSSSSFSSSSFSSSSSQPVFSTVSATSNLTTSSAASSSIGSSSGGAFTSILRARLTTTTSTPSMTAGVSSSSTLGTGGANSKPASVTISVRPAAAAAVTSSCSMLRSQLVSSLSSRLTSGSSSSSSSTSSSSGSSSCSTSAFSHLTSTPRVVYCSQPPVIISSSSANNAHATSASSTIGMNNNTSTLQAMLQASRTTTASSTNSTSSSNSFSGSASLSSSNSTTSSNTTSTTLSSSTSSQASSGNNDGSRCLVCGHPAVHQSPNSANYHQHIMYTPQPVAPPVTSGSNSGNSGGGGGGHDQPGVLRVLIPSSSSSPVPTIVSSSSSSTVPSSGRRSSRSRRRLHSTHRLAHIFELEMRQAIDRVRARQLDIRETLQALDHLQSEAGVDGGGMSPSSSSTAGQQSAGQHQLHHQTEAARLALQSEELLSDNFDINYLLGETDSTVGSSSDAGGGGTGSSSSNNNNNTGAAAERHSGVGGGGGNGSGSATGSTWLPPPPPPPPISPIVTSGSALPTNTSSSSTGVNTGSPQVQTAPPPTTTTTTTTAAGTTGSSSNAVTMLSAELNRRIEHLNQLERNVSDITQRLGVRMRSLNEDRRRDLGRLRSRITNSQYSLSARLRERQDRLRAHLDEIHRRYRGGVPGTGGGSASTVPPHLIPEITVTPSPDDGSGGDHNGSDDVNGNRNANVGNSSVAAAAAAAAHANNTPASSSAPYANNSNTITTTGSTVSEAEAELRGLQESLNEQHERAPDVATWSRNLNRDIENMRSEMVRRRQRERERERTWHSLQRRHLHPHYAVSILDDTINRENDGLQAAINRAIAGAFMGTGEAAVASNIVNLTHRIQSWDFTQFRIPDISDATCNVLVPHCKLHNDASVDISQDGRYLGTFVPSHRGFPDDTILGVFSLQQDTMGQCVFTKSFGPNAISLSLSPLSNYVLVGLAAKRLAWVFTPKQMVAQVYKLKSPQAGEDSMEHICDLMHPCELDIRSHISVNSARWLPRVGEGVVYGTNRGDLHICRPGDDESGHKSARNVEVDGSESSSIRRNIMQMLGLAIPSTTSTSTQTIHRLRRTASTQTDMANMGDEQ